MGGINIHGITTDCCHTIRWARLGPHKCVHKTTLIYILTVMHRVNYCFVLLTFIWLIPETLITGKKHWNSEFIYLSASLTTWPLHWLKSRHSSHTRQSQQKLMWVYVWVSGSTSSSKTWLNQPRLRQTAVATSGSSCNHPSFKMERNNESI